MRLHYGIKRCVLTNILRDFGTAISYMLVTSSLLAGEIDFMSPLRSLGWLPGRRIMSIHTQRRFRGERSVENSGIWVALD
jgi:hypothetical protein